MPPINYSYFLRLFVLSIIFGLIIAGVLRAFASLFDKPDATPTQKKLQKLLSALSIFAGCAPMACMILSTVAFAFYESLWQGTFIIGFTAAIIATGFAFKR